MHDRIKRHVGTLAAGALGVLALVLVLAALTATSPAALAGPGDPAPGTVRGIRTFTFYPTTMITGNDTLYSASPRYASGLDVTHVRNWHSADVFVTTDVSGTAAVTVTAQYGPDGTNWTDAEYLSEGWVTTTTRSSAWVPYRTTLSSDGTEFFRLPIAGEYVRFKIEYTGTLTLTVQATMRND